MNLKQVLAGIEMDYDEEDFDLFISDVIVIAKVIDGDGKSQILVKNSKDIDCITQVGMMQIAQTITQGEWENVEEQD